ncbi:hypothetical protein [Cyclobacterium xiamenense]|uniref:hypothetical protein n=1 Tax=Cyclobacterium xiamenense TaxID=1297121 RepID=UPI0015A67C05|nr:hypothetical protein [Cyclobacterium xiamenense]
MSTRTSRYELLQPNVITFDFKRRTLISGPHLLGSLLILSGILALVGTSFLNLGDSLERNLAVGMAAILLGLPILSTYGGTRIDFSGNRYKNYRSIAGFRQGAWKTLPLIVRVELIETKRRRTNQPNGISPTLSGNVIEFTILMYASAPRPLFVFVYTNGDKALEQAQLLASALKCKLVLPISQSTKPGRQGTE